MRVVLVLLSASVVAAARTKKPREQEQLVSEQVISQSSGCCMKANGEAVGGSVADLAWMPKKHGSKCPASVGQFWCENAWFSQPTASGTQNQAVKFGFVYLKGIQHFAAKQECMEMATDSGSNFFDCTLPRTAAAKEGYTDYLKKFHRRHGDFGAPDTRDVTDFFQDRSDPSLPISQKKVRRGGIDMRCCCSRSDACYLTEQAKLDELTDNVFREAGCGALDFGLKNMRWHSWTGMDNRRCIVHADDPLLRSLETDDAEIQ